MKSAFNVFTSYLFLLFLAACSGGGDITDDGTDGGTSVDQDSISIALTIDNTQISAASPATLTAEVKTGGGSPVNTLVTFSLNDATYGTFTPATGAVATDSSGVATITLNTASISTGATVTATTSTGESATVNVTMAGDGGTVVAGGGAQVAVTLTDANGNPIQSISTLTPGKVTAMVSGVSKSVIVTFDTTIGDLPIKSAVTDARGVASVDIYAGNALGAGEVSATLSTGEVGKAIVVVGATNVVMGSGTPFVAGTAEVSTDVLSAGGTATISVQIQDDQGSPYTQPVDVSFSSRCVSAGSAQISTPVATNNGVATSTYLAKGCVGDDQINVTANAGGKNLSATGMLEVLPADVGSIVFDSATPQTISILGTGGVESSTVKFQVLDKNSNPVSNQNVLFALNTNAGGVTFAPPNATTDANGMVQTVVTTGTVATSLRVTATVDNGAVPAISSQSKQLIVSTGIPDQDSFSLSVDKLNPEGWDIDGAVVVVTARMADAFNNPVPDGTTISFTTEGGSIGDHCSTVNGACSVKWTSQLPRPEGNTLFDGSGAMTNNPDANLSFDATLGIYGNMYGQKYGGRATITATAIGEESFPDLNGNGRFDASEMSEFLNGTDVTGHSFDLTDAFNDYNEDGLFNPQDTSGTGQQGGSLEELIDFNADGVFQVADQKYNGVLCSDPVHSGCADGVTESKSLYVRRSLVIVMSGSTAYSTPASDVLITDKDGAHVGGGITIEGKGTASVIFVISDRHNQQMPAGTKVSFSATAGSVVSSTQYVWPSSNYNGGREFTVTLKGEDQDDSGVFLVEVETPSGLVTQALSVPITTIKAP
ncbi:hypothetical protein LZP69_05450 [Shewanella sp. AS1]|uniref:Ig-like domain-containing protein n=1 Tax=Shewanella sp. AS1 TaxID=2907626 RepID=UPI001F1ED5DC|nr:hypothetical protein [Shewanella sp. AS1]MCE9678638.1 hypothetical protein [Shewanella sp. AS1]